MATDKQKVYAGAVLLAISSVLILAAGPFEVGISNTVAGIIAALAALGLAAGSLLLGTSEEGRAV